MTETHEWSGGGRKLDIDNSDGGAGHVCCERMALLLTQECGNTDLPIGANNV
jgi:hypothetical protein